MLMRDHADTKLDDLIYLAGAIDTHHSAIVELGLVDNSEDEELVKLGYHITSRHPWLLKSKLIPLVFNESYCLFIANSIPYAYDYSLDQFFVLGDGSLKSGLNTWHTKNMHLWWVADENGRQTKERII
jgi:hypothetical protein